MIVDALSAARTRPSFTFRDMAIVMVAGRIGEWSLQRERNQSIGRVCGRIQTGSNSSRGTRFRRASAGHSVEQVAAESGRFALKLGWAIWEHQMSQPVTAGT